MEFKTIYQNLEYARRKLVLAAIQNLQDTIALCYGKGEYPLSNFSNERVKDVYYVVNDLACQLYDELKKMDKSSKEKGE